MRILSNLIVTGSLNSNKFFSLAPVSASLISGSFETGSVNIFANEEKDLLVSLDDSANFWTLVSPVLDKFESASFSYLTAFFDCVVTQSVSGSGGFDRTLLPGTSSFTSSYSSSYSGSAYTGSISGSRRTRTGYESGSTSQRLGAYSDLISGTDRSFIWDSFGVVQRNGFGYVFINDSIPNPSGSCDPKYVDSQAFYESAYKLFENWKNLLCNCLIPGDSIDVDFTVFYWCNFPDNNPENNKQRNKTFTFKIRKGRSGKCYIYNINRGKTLGGIINKDDTSNNSTLMLKEEGSNVVSVAEVDYLQVPSSNISADSYYDFDNKGGILNYESGLLYFNESDSTLYVYTGANWESVGGSGELSKYTTTIGNDSSTSFVVTHNKNTRDVQVTVRETNAPYEIVFPVINLTSVNTITVDFGVTVPSSNQYTVTVI